MTIQKPSYRWARTLLPKEFQQTTNLICISTLQPHNNKFPEQTSPLLPTLPPSPTTHSIQEVGWITGRIPGTHLKQQHPILDNTKSMKKCRAWCRNLTILAHHVFNTSALLSLPLLFSSPSLASSRNLHPLRHFRWIREQHNHYRCTGFSRHSTAIIHETLNLASGWPLPAKGKHKPSLFTRPY